MGPGGLAGDRPPEAGEQTDTSGWTVDVTPSIDTPDETVTDDDDNEYLVTETGRVRPGNDLTVAVDAPDTTTDYEIQLRETGENTFVRRDTGQRTGDSSVTWDTGETDSRPALQPRSYAAIAKNSGTVEALQPVVVTGYGVDVFAPDTVTEETAIDVRATLTELSSPYELPPIDSVEVVVWETGTEDEIRRELTKLDPMEYETTVDRPAADYNLAVVVLGEIDTDVIEPVGLSDRQVVSVVSGPMNMSPDWHVDTGHRLQYSRPALDSERLFVGGLRSEIAAYDRSTADRQWQFDRAGALSDSSPVLDGSVYVGSGGGVLYALAPDPASQSRVDWQHDLGRAITATPAIADGTVFVGTNAGTVAAITAADGGLSWEYDVGAPVYSALEATQDRVFVTTADGDVVALDHAGTEVWRYPTGGRLGAASPVHAGGSVFVAGETVTALTAADGQVEWHQSEYGDATGATPAVDSGSVYVGDADGIVFALNASDGTIEWSLSLAGPATPRPGVASNRVVVGDRDGTVVLVDRATGDWLDAASLATSVRSPFVVDNGTAFVGTRRGTVEVFESIT